MTDSNRHIIIIGNGIAGITCARHVRKHSNARITIISGESDYFFSRTALMYVYMGHMKFEHTQPYENWFWEKNRLKLKKAWVTNVDARMKQIQLDTGEHLKYDDLVIATGSIPNRFGWKGQDLKGVQGLYSKQDLELLEANTHPPKSRNNRVKKAVIVGGGLIGVELAEMLLSRNIEVTFLVRESRFWGNVLSAQESTMIETHLKKHHVKLFKNAELDEILGDQNGRVKAIKTKNGEELECQFVGLTAGVQPNINWLKDSEIATNSGVLVNAFFETNQPNIYAIGDCAEFEQPENGIKAINQVWYTGRIMGETLAQTLVGNRSSYRPGPWFNSAKFFDIEYQTYGEVLPDQTAEIKTFYWQKDERAISIQFHAASNEFLGINTFGIRMRHELFDNWLKQKVKVTEVLSNLQKANFDPEFYKAFEDEIIAHWNSQFPELKVKPTKRFFVF